jgi:uncharacterized protein (TIGR03435 family)
MCRSITWSAWLIPLLAAGAVFAQDTRPSPEFEVASVKLAAPQTGGGAFVGIRRGPGTQDATRITYVNESLRNLLTEAYGVKAWQVAGPDWIDTERYDITAKIAEGAGKDQVRVMLQNLLTERFGAVVHHETRDFPIFELTIAKSGSKLRSSSSAPPAAADSNGPPPSGGTGMMMTMQNGVNRLIAGRQTLETLARVLENGVGSHVSDKTGLTGTYDFALDFVRDLGRTIDQFKGLRPGPSAAVDGLGDAPGLASALQEQFGIRLEKARGQLDVIVVD